MGLWNVFVFRLAQSSGCDGSKFFILLIVTDGIITDFEQTKAAIVDVSDLGVLITISGLVMYRSICER